MPRAARISCSVFPLPRTRSCPSRRPRPRPGPARPRHHVHPRPTPRQHAAVRDVRAALNGVADQRPQFRERRRQLVEMVLQRRPRVDVQGVPKPRASSEASASSQNSRPARYAKRSMGRDRRSLGLPDSASRSGSARYHGRMNLAALSWSSPGRHSRNRACGPSRPRRLPRRSPKGARHYDAAGQRTLMPAYTNGADRHAAVRVRRRNVGDTQRGGAVGQGPASARSWTRPARRLVMFGGRSPFTNVPNAQTWEWDGNSWLDRTGPGPSARGSIQLVYDSARGRNGALRRARPVPHSLGTHGNGTGAAWLLVATTGPSPRGNAAMAYDAARARVVLFGGPGTSTTPFEDLWEWDGAAWTLRPVTGPGPGAISDMIYDTQRARIVLHHVLDRVLRARNLGVRRTVLDLPHRFGAYDPFSDNHSSTTGARPWALDQAVDGDVGVPRATPRWSPSGSAPRSPSGSSRPGRPSSSRPTWRVRPAHLSMAPQRRAAGERGQHLRRADAEPQH
jgi:hypothetical protein